VQVATQNLHRIRDALQAGVATGTVATTKALALALSVALQLGLVSAARAGTPRLPCRDANETLCGDGGPATAARLLRPAGVASGGGGLLIADTGNNAIRRVLATGVISTAAGLGTPGYSGDGGPAFAAQLKAPADVSAAPGGAVLIADAGNGVIRKLSATGVITTVAGAPPGAPAAAPSTTPASARSVRLSNPQGVAALPGGGFLIADTGAHVVELVTPAGLISVVAGVGAPGNTGDAGPAQAAALNLPTRVVPTADGGFLILDLGNLVVRSVSPTGTITTVAGSQSTPSTPFGVALNPGGLAQDPQGNVYVIADHQVRRVAPDGTVTTIAGTGECGSGGDGGPAVDATLAQPAGLALTPAGDVLVADINNGGSAVGNVRRVSGADGSIATVAGASNDASACVGAGGSPSGALWPIFYITAPRSARAGRAITIRYSTTRAGSVRASLLKKGRTVRTKKQAARPGGNAVTLSGVKKGTYTMRITAKGDLPNNNADAGGTLRLSKRFDAALQVKR
jgi:hypothetical protein